MTLVDSHVHVNLDGFSLKHLMKYLNQEKIDYCWLLSWEEINPGPWTYKHLSVEDIYEAYLQYPSRIIPFYAPDPHRPDVSLLMEKWSQKGIRGCGELKTTLNWDSGPVKSILETARKLKMPVVFHMEDGGNEIPYSNTFFDKLLFYGLRTNKTIYRIPKSILTILVNHYTPLQKRIKSPYCFPGYMLDFSSLEAALKEYPDVNLVGHGIMFWKHISKYTTSCQEPLPTGPITSEGVIWRLLKDYPNLYVDISAQSGFNALTRDIPRTKKFLSLFEDKILFGTDNFINGQKEFFNSLLLSKVTYKKIYGENAIKIMGNK